MTSGVNFKDNTGPVHIINQPRVLRASVIGKLIEIISNPVGGEQSLTEKHQILMLKSHSMILKETDG